jgi:type VI secretion system protein ImpB
MVSIGGVISGNRTDQRSSSMPESVHGKLSRVRKPRVHITYEVETEGATVLKDLPFVVGVMGDFSGHPTEPLKPLKDRKFVSIDRDSFNDVMKRMTPGVEMRVNNTLADDGSEMAVKLKFSSMEDFEPAKIVEQVEPLRKLLDTRNRLRELMSAVDRAEGLEGELEKLLQDSEQLHKLAGEMGVGSDPAADSGDGAGSDEGA